MMKLSWLQIKASSLLAEFLSQIFGNNLSLNSELTFKETCKLDVWRLGLLLVKRVLENFDISKIYLMKEEMKV